MPSPLLLHDSPLLPHPLTLLPFITPSPSFTLIPYLSSLTPCSLTLPSSSLGLYPSPLLLHCYRENLTVKFCKILERIGEDFEYKISLPRKKNLNPDSHHLEKWDSYPHYNVLDPPHWL